ncbi:MAG TPA: hypothetical protein VNO81_13305 [Candidatus Nitrosotenuis sp.]|jgi:hypothetical protein|nr:hypothetical protein [Candidatus Nitrosotenuis sp.]
MVLTRLQNFRRNASGWGQFKFGLIFLFLVAVAFLPGTRWFSAVSLTCFALAWLARDWLVEHCRSVLRVVDAAPLVFLTVGLVSKQMLPRMTPLQETTFAFVVSVLIGLYLGAFFWILSDPRLQVEGSARAHGSGDPPAVTGPLCPSAEVPADRDFPPSAARPAGAGQESGPRPPPGSA